MRFWYENDCPQCVLRPSVLNGVRDCIATYSRLVCHGRRLAVVARVLRGKRQGDDLSSVVSTGKESLDYSDFLLGYDILSITFAFWLHGRSHLLWMRSRQCRRLSSTCRPEADRFASGPTHFSSCQPAGPTTLLGDEVGERGPSGAGQDAEHRPSTVFIIKYQFNPMARCSSCPRHRYWHRPDIGIATGSQLWIIQLYDKLTISIFV